MNRDLPDMKWLQLEPAKAGFDTGRLREALAYAAATEIDAPTDLTTLMPDGSRHPNDRPLGPVKPRGKPSGAVVRRGCLVGGYGDVRAPEVTFSVTKSYISACAGLAFDKGFIADLDERVGARVRDGGFDAPHNAGITWRHLLQQTSEWEGELFGVPDWIDRGRLVSNSSSMRVGSQTIGASAAAAAEVRVPQTPGSFWEYNDVRVNRTALAVMRVLGETLPEALRAGIMGPIGASGSWQWHGYDTSWVELNGRKVQSVSGGAHWGGGLWISTLDHARFGLLYLGRGNWNGRQLLSDEWVRMSLTPCEIKPGYGFLWWLNHDGAVSQSASEQAFAARGAGGNIIFADPALDLVIVLRWCADTRSVLDRIIDSLA